MIEYKFRGKRVDNGEWVYGKLFFLDNPDFYSILPVGGLAFPEVSTESETGRYLSETGRYLIEPIEVIPETIGQSTGLHDKNGVEIYEGDILKSNQCSHLFVVKFGDHGYSAYTDCVELGFYAHCTDEIERNRGIREDLPFWVREVESQVIGNIHDKE